MAASCADDPQQHIIARARRICRGRWMGGPGLHARDPGRCRLLPCARRRHEETSTGVGRQRIKRKGACRTRAANGHRMRWRTRSSVGCCVSRPGHPVAWPPGAVERMSSHDKVTIHTLRRLRHAKPGDPAQGMHQLAESPRKAWSSGRCRNRLWRWC